MKDFATSIGTPDAAELVICEDTRLACETYVFEPASAEASLGRLYAVGETEDRQGIGKELLDMTIQALQREYYRDPTRTPTASFESALHQANIVLHDAAEQGLRDWMGHWHVAVAVVADAALHISTAGDATIFLVRKGKTTLLTEDLSYSPVTDPLRTFSQVASGALASRDVLFLGTGGFSAVFRPEDLVRFSVEHAATTISTRLGQLYADQQSALPVGALTISILPRHIAAARPTIVTDTTTSVRRENRQRASLLPRQPLVIHRTALRAAFALGARFSVALGRWLTQRVWPLMVRGGGAVGRNVHSVTKQGVQRWQTRRTSLSPASTIVQPVSRRVSWQSILLAPRYFVHHVRVWLVNLPRTSKIFAGLAVVLGIVLLVSILLLQSKRADDTAIQQASERLHAAQTKVAAAETALIYDNRDQARNLLVESTSEANALVAEKVYEQEAQDLLQDIAVMQDRLQKVLRSSTSNTQVIGDFGSDLGSDTAGGLAFVDGRLFSFNTKTNAVLAMTDTGEVSTVSETSQGIGSLQLAIPHAADKNIVFITDAPGVALFDTKAGTLSEQEISLPSEEADIATAAVYGSRLYVTEATPTAMYSYNKTLRGYSGRTNWLTATDFPLSTLVSLAVDGSIYTLHSDGSVHELFKGAPTEWKTEPVDPPLAGARKIVTAEGLAHLYIFDPDKKRVVIFTKEGALVRQIVLDVATQLHDIAIAEDESTLYILDGTRVLGLPLGSEE